MSGDDGHAYGILDYAHHMADTPLGELSAFAHAFGGVRSHGGSVVGEAGALGGLELRF